MEPVSAARFEELVIEAIDAVPEPFASALGEVAVIIESAPPRGRRRYYGLYVGHPRTAGDVSAPHQPPRILLGMRALMADFPTEDELREQVRITLLHELGHHLGMDEARLSDLGYG